MIKITKNNSFSNILIKSLSNKSHFFHNISFPYQGLLYFDEKTQQLVTYNLKEKPFDLYVTGLYFDLRSEKDNMYTTSKDIEIYIKNYIQNIYKITLLHEFFLFDYKYAFEYSDIELLQQELGNHFSVLFFSEIVHSTLLKDERWYNNYFKYDQQNTLFEHTIQYLLHIDLENIQLIDCYLYIFIVRHNNSKETEKILKQFSKFKQIVDKMESEKEFKKHFRNKTLKE